MAYRFFLVPVRNSDPTAEELNRFLRGHRVLSVDRRWVDLGTESFWSFCVDYLETAPQPGNAAGPPRDPRGKVDYREVLSPEEFALFVKGPRSGRRIPRLMSFAAGSALDVGLARVNDLSLPSLRDPG